MEQRGCQFLISVIIPAYNAEDHVDKCMDSLEKQTLSKNEFEVIVVDDCSTDNTLEKVVPYKNILNLKIARLANNSGPGIARNKGVDLAKGEYILFLDGDDLLIPNALICLSMLIKKNKYDLITYNWTYSSDVENNLTLVPRRRDLENMPIKHTELVIHYLGMNMDGSVIYTMGKKSLFEQYNIRFSSGYHEDMAVIFKMYYAAKTILKVDEVLYLKRNVEGSIVNTLTKKHVDGYLNAWPTIFEFLKDQGVEVDDYITHYLRGMSGHVYTLLKKNFDINGDDLKSRILIYEFIIKALGRDVNLRKPYATWFPNVTEKDAVSQLFFAHIEMIQIPLIERVKQFELALSIKC